MDIREANCTVIAYSPYPCGYRRKFRFDGKDCGNNTSGKRNDGVGDKDDRNVVPYHMGKVLDYDSNLIVTMTACHNNSYCDNCDSYRYNLGPVY